MQKIKKKLFIIDFLFNLEIELHNVGFFLKEVEFFLILCVVKKIFRQILQNCLELLNSILIGK